MKKLSQIAIVAALVVGSIACDREPKVDEAPPPTATVAPAETSTEATVTETSATTETTVTTTDGSTSATTGTSPQ